MLRKPAEGCEWKSREWTWFHNFYKEGGQTGLEGLKTCYLGATRGLELKSSGFKSYLFPLCREHAAGQSVSYNHGPLWGTVLSKGKQRSFKDPRPSPGCHPNVRWSREKGEESRSIHNGRSRAGATPCTPKAPGKQNKHPSSLLTRFRADCPAAQQQLGFRHTDAPAALPEPDFRVARTLRVTSRRHRATCRESGLLARESEIRSAEAELLGLGAAVDRRRKEPAGQLSDRSAGAVFVSLLRPKRAAPPEAVSVGRVETDRPVSRGVGLWGTASPSLGGSRGLQTLTVSCRWRSLPAASPAPSLEFGFPTLRPARRPGFAPELP